ncbi:MAG: DeoR/GlpR transcriptional regulator [Chloroflexi bacterium]|nr:DeoR/GlpR transcriptional regulator [Chloroflexota bacterium]
MKTKNFVSNTERLERIVDFIESRKSITVAEVASEFSIGMTTARRDLDTLADQGKIQRVHGGAMALPKAPPEPPALYRTQEQAVEKQKIGRLAAALIEDGDTVFLGAGTTVMEVARELVNRRDLTVITNSLLVINTLAEAPGINMVVLGGFFRSSEKSFIGHMTEQALAEFRAAKVVMGVRAVDVELGLTEEFPPEAQTNRAVLKIGQQVIIVADHTKFGRVAGAFIAPVTAVNIMVTDSNTPQEYIQALEAQGVRVIKD